MILFNFNKMPKRRRSSSAEIVKIDEDGTAVVEYKGRLYAWFVPSDVSVEKIQDTNEYEIQIIHNFEHKAMIDITDIRQDQTVLRQEINPLEHKNVDEWVVDSE